MSGDNFPHMRPVWPDEDDVGGDPGLWELLGWTSGTLFAAVLVSIGLWIWGG